MLLIFNGPGFQKTRESRHKPCFCRFTVVQINWHVREAIAHFCCGLSISRLFSSPRISRHAPHLPIHGLINQSRFYVILKVNNYGTDFQKTGLSEDQRIAQWALHSQIHGCAKKLTCVRNNCALLRRSVNKLFIFKPENRTKRTAFPIHGLGNQSRLFELFQYARQHENCGTDV